MMRRNRRTTTNAPATAPPPPKQSSEANAQKAQQANAKYFPYPPQGFETPIEHSLLFTMIRESSIFPPETVLEAIANEEYTQYFYVKEEESEKQQNKSNRRALDDSSSPSNNNDNAAAAAAAATHPSNISYAQLSALLALAGEKWSESTKVPEKLCQCISKHVVKYANQHDLDRTTELQDLIDPLLKYAQKARNQQSLRLLPWFAALTVSTVNPLAFYTTYMTMIAVNGENLAKRDMADRNTVDIMEFSHRKANVEKASLLDEDYNEELDDGDDNYHNYQNKEH